MSEHSPVLIVGAGPTGLMMGCELARHGIPFRIIDKNAEPTKGSNATWIQTRTLEILDAMDIVDQFLRIGHHCESIHFYVKGKSVANIPLNTIDSVYPFILMLPQRDTERLLNEKLVQSHIQVERSLELIECKQTNDGVISTVRLPNGNTEIITSDWVVACDGVNSTVRNECHISFQGKDLPEQFMVADAQMSSYLPKNAIHVFVDKGTIFPERATLFSAFPCESQEYRLSANLYLEKPRLTYTQQEVKEIVAERTYGNYVVNNVSWISPFWIHSKVVDRMRQGSIFLAGDAAHTHSPVGGQGMNTGLQDAHNLAWKLALVIKNEAKHSLLDSYQSERYPIVSKIVNETEFFTNMMLFDKSFVSKLKKFGQTVSKDTEFSKKISMQLTQLDTHYENSPVIDYNETMSGNAPQQGEFAPNLIMTKTKKFYDYLSDENHNVLVFTGDKPSEATLNQVKELHGLISVKFPKLINISVITREELSGIENTILDAEGAVHKRYGITTPFIYVVRPDNYIGYCSKLADSLSIANFLQQYLIEA